MVRGWRNQAGLSQRAVARGVAISTAELSRIEAGTNRPSARVWVRLIRFLGVTPSQPAWELFVRDEVRCRRLIALADELLDQGLVQEGRWVVTAADQLNRTSFNGRYNGELERLWGRLALAEGDYVLACTRFEQMTRSATKGSLHRQAIAAYDYGLALNQLSRWVDGLDQLAIALRLFEQEGDVPRQGYVHWASGTALLRMGDYRSAEMRYKRAALALQGTPGASYVRYGSLICAYVLGEAPKAIQEKLLDLVPEASDGVRTRIYHFLGTLTRLQGNPSGALAWLDQALSLEVVGSSEWCDTQSERVLCLCLSGREPEAAELWSRVAEHWSLLDEHNAMAMSVLGLALHQSRPRGASDRALYPRHHEQRVDAAIAWAWGHASRDPHAP